MVEHLRLVSAEVAKQVLKYDALIPAVEKALESFSHKAEFGVVQPLRTIVRIPSADG
jgi:hypothetical protein